MSKSSYRKSIADYKDSVRAPLAAEDVPYQKKRDGSRSRAAAHSKHKHIYAEGYIKHQWEFLDHVRYFKVTYCTICGRVSHCPMLGTVAPEDPSLPIFEHDDKWNVILN